MKFYEIKGEFKENFRICESSSDFVVWAIHKAAYEITSIKEFASAVWCKNRLWWDDETYGRCCMWITNNGILMYELVDEEKLYRVEDFDYD